jgi:hypothetical protein
VTVLPKLVERDRGLGTAYERYCFYERMEAWRTRYGIESMLEGPVDGMAGIHGVHGVGMARKGVKVTSALVTEEEATIARDVYARNAGGEGGSFVVRGGVAPSVAAIESLPMADLVLCYHALPFVDDWQTYARAMAARARKLFVVAICNPDNWGVSAVKLLALARGNSVRPPDVWHTKTLAPVLWSLGRVREHAYFDCPWWPDMPVAAGQSVSDRLKQLAFGKRKDVGLQAPVEAKLADKFVYGPDKWPYFGEDAAWTTELLPALLRHPGFDGGSSKWLAKVAHLHAFVVDVEPRTPQARRRLHLQEADPTKV